MNSQSETPPTHETLGPSRAEPVSYASGVLRHKSGRPLRLLVVGMQNNVHVARWLRNLEHSGIEVAVFPVYDLEAHPLIRGVSVFFPTFEAAAAPGSFFRRAPGQAIRLAASHLWSQPRDASKRPAPLLLRRPRAAIEGAWSCLTSGSAAPAPRPRKLKSGGAGRRQFLQLPLTQAELGGVDPRETPNQRLGESEQAAPTLFGPHALVQAIRRFQPDLVHSLEFQHCGYLTLRAKELYGDGFPRWAASNWGADIHYYRQFSDHRRQIARLLGEVDFYFAECERDIAIARELGLRGVAMPVMSGAGGFDLEQCARLRAPGPTSSRRLLLVKGYQHFAGRALTALEILRRNADVLARYEILVYLASPGEVRDKITELSKEGMRIRVLETVSHEEMLGYFGRARVYLGLSESDGISTSVLDSMVMGTFPIQTNTACCDEWFADGVGGFAVNLHDLDGISARLRRAVQDDELVDRAAGINWESGGPRLAQEAMRTRIRAAYARMFAD